MSAHALCVPSFGGPLGALQTNYYETEPPPPRCRSDVFLLLASRLLPVFLMLRVAAAMFIVAEDQRFDHHRHRFGIRQLLADVDEVEIF